MRLRRPSSPTVVTFVLLLLLPTLAVLQYRWVGQVSEGERDRMQRSLRNSAAQFRNAFDGELARAVLSLQVGPATARDGASEQYSNRYNTWLDTADHPDIVAAIYLVDAEADRLRLRRWSAETHTFEPTDWPARLDAIRPELERERAEFTASRADRRRPFPVDDSLIVAPLRSVVQRGRGISQTVTPIFGFTVIELDTEYIRTRMLPELAARYFTHGDDEVYRVSVTAFDDPGAVLYRSAPDAPTDVRQADVTTALFGGFFGRGPRGDRGDRTGAAPGELGRDGPGAPPAVRFGGGLPRGWEEIGRWRLLAQHQSGSLAEAVARVQRRNLAISFGVLLLLTVSIGLLAMTSRRAQRLARQQMEFVAGVSHELRTPVAVIRSAAENLSHGVISGERVKRYGALLEAESRRLGEMVERILHFAGIESGLALGVKAPLAPREIIEAAIAGAVSAADGVPPITIERHIAEDLPPVVGDAAALRSAVENLIANALKYGGTDRWVGIRAERARERGRTEVRITVSDHGPGIPQSELRHIFEPFYRGADAVSRQIHGNGLGLSLVKRIVAAHGGRVTVATRAGAGSAFTIALPAGAADPGLGTVAAASPASHVPASTRITASS